MTRLKLYLMNTIVWGGSFAIIWFQWPEAMRPRGFAAGTVYEQSQAATTFQAVILTAIPVLFFAVVAYVALSHVLFKRGELKAYQLRQIVEDTKPDRKPQAATPRQPDAMN